MVSGHKVPGQNGPKKVQEYKGANIFLTIEKCFSKYYYLSCKPDMCKYISKKS